jgi:hypothetical protein
LARFCTLNALLFDARRNAEDQPDADESTFITVLGFDPNPAKTPLLAHVPHVFPIPPGAWAPDNISLADPVAIKKVKDYYTEHLLTEWNPINTRIDAQVFAETSMDGMGFIASPSMQDLFDMAQFAAKDTAGLPHDCPTNNLTAHPVDRTYDAELYAATFSRLQESQQADAILTLTAANIEEERIRAQNETLDSNGFAVVNVPATTRPPHQSSLSQPPPTPRSHPRCSLTPPRPPPAPSP